MEKQDQYELEGQIYEDVFVVEIANFESRIEYRQGTEVYAPKIGLIYQEIQGMDTQCEYCCNLDLGACGPIAWVDKAEKGMIFRKRLIR